MLESKPMTSPTAELGSENERKKIPIFIFSFLSCFTNRRHGTVPDDLGQLPEQAEIVVSNRLTYGVADSIPGTSTHHAHEIMNTDKKAGSDQLNTRLEAFIDRHSRQSRYQPCMSLRFVIPLYISIREHTDDASPSGGEPVPNLANVREAFLRTTPILTTDRTGDIINSNFSVINRARASLLRSFQGQKQRIGVQGLSVSQSSHATHAIWLFREV
ncbi:hypothetical protein CDEST_07195 [Colletotrichum destructivum]|uniref:Uncharacterized protein n=1 Tax=Colletotrichum destructivum TaxID=34406 RepID=A0AAX4IGY9_9PEZI|nr:hypothetical protein CDEST_07195 [Colletotrichum destructivum]